MIPIAPTVFWGPMAFAIIGGLAVATVLTLIFLPALYVAWFRVSEPAPSRSTDVRSRFEMLGDITSLCAGRASFAVSHERVDPVGHHIRIDTGRHFSRHAASPHFAGTSSERACQRCRAAWSWLDCDNSRVGSWTAHRICKGLVRYANQSSQADHRRPDPARQHSGPVWTRSSSRARTNTQHSRSVCRPALAREGGRLKRSL